MDINWGRFVGTALVVGLIGPLFWLVVQVLSNYLQGLVNKGVASWRAKQSHSQE